ncbi:hypothetical protein PIROE2DRAFT_15776 [Piromyces sp. E2]|nr:hypothetical protein PIROE2DRAFT_15776 [Piromyces sp. E2]|eukprot:OUM58847.1 hypothetical protein PIROE2DRAFT_15776 [Piromyces sp. E2]
MKLVSLMPVITTYSVLYSNTKLLGKYNKTIPETWDEFLETGSYIVSEEKKANNKISGYNSIFGDSDSSTGSLAEFIYSYRKSVDSPFPNIINEEAVNALEMLKKIKENVASDDEFINGESFIYQNAFSGNALFFKYWAMSDYDKNVFKITHLPGVKKGISASLTGGTNIGVNNYINDDRKKAAAKVIEYMVSKEAQRKYVTTGNGFTMLNELYDGDEEVCSKLDCDFFKNIQVVTKYNSDRTDYISYSEKFRNYAYEFLYGNKTALEVLNKINDITRVYYITLNNEHSNIGLTIFIVNSALLPHLKDI